MQCLTTTTARSEFHGRMLVSIVSEHILQTGSKAHWPWCCGVQVWMQDNTNFLRRGGDDIEAVSSQRRTTPNPTHRHVSIGLEKTMQPEGG